MIAETLEWRVLLSGYTFNSVSLPAQYPNGQIPLSQLVRDGNGNLFGTTWEGGTYGDGTVFEIAAGSTTPTTLVSFNGTNGDQPFYDSLTLDSSGNLYGTTYQGGSNDDGTVFEIKAGTSSLTTLATFTGTNGANPQGGVALDAAGDVFGTTRAGGSKSDGTIFEVKAGTNSVTTLATFTGANGATPEGAIALDANGDIFGTTEGYNSAAYSNGTVFELPAGSTTITTLFGFSGSNGANPYGGVTLGGSGNLYGTTYAGGSNNDGTVFAIKSGVFTSIASFTGANGSVPYANVTLDGSGDLIGTAAAGGVNDDGTVFEIAAGSTTITTLASFNGTNGNGPEAAVTLDPAGDLFGTTESGGAGGSGAVFEIAAGSSTIADLASFGAGTVGAYPEAGVTTDAVGDVFGTTMSGGVNNDGTVFEIPAGTTTVTTLATFNGINGSAPEATLTLDASGNLFGTTEGGGTYGDGTVFEIKAGTTTISTLASFNGTTGNSPSTPVTLDASGNLYGLSTEGGSGGGTVFEVKAGTNVITVLANLTTTTGDYPAGGLTFDSKGNLWGTTSADGNGTSKGYGTVIEIKSGTTTVTKVANFSATTGEYPYAGLTLDASGNFWGTTSSGGSGYGTVFEVKSGATSITKVASFTSSTGEDPEGGVTFDASGNLFGTTTAGGASGYGTVYEIKAGTSTLTALTSFTGDNGASPYDAVTLTPNGDLFGTANIGGAAGTGAVFVLSPITATVTDNVGGSSVTQAKGTAVAGSTVVYTIKVSNPGPFAATNVTVSDPVPTGVSSLVWSGDGKTNVSGAISDTIASLAAGSSVTYTATATITPSATGTLASTATVGSNANTTNSANTTATDTDTLTTQSDLSVTVSDNVGGTSGPTATTGAATPGGSVTYTVVVSNAGPSTASNVSVLDPLPTGVTAFSWSGNGKTNQPGALSNSIATLAPGASVTYTVVATISPSATGSLSNTATVSTSNDPVTSNNTATDSDHLFAPTTTTVTDGGGTYNGNAFPATAKVNGQTSLEGVYPQSTYYAGSSATGTPLAGAPSALGTYTVVASFPGSADYARSTSAPFTFSIDEAPSLTVTTNQDVVNPTDGLTSLREAITYANSIGGGTITFASAVTGTITLNGTQLPAVSSNVTINGPGANVLAVSGNNASREFSVGPGVTASINGLTLTDAYLSSAPGTNLDDYGGAVLNEGSLTLSGDAITGNSAFTGGAVYSTPFAAGGTASVTILDSTISGNTAAFSGGVATGVSDGTSNVRIVNSTIAFNDATASQVDSGILVQSSNSAGVCSVVLDDDTVVGNNQGGVFVQSISGGTVGFSTQGSLFALNSNDDIDNAGATVDPGSSYNLVADGSGGLPTAPANDNLFNVNPLVAPLGSYGGPTQTIPLLPGSPAIGAGVPIAGVTTDQTGYTRSANAPSIGAYENEGFTIQATGGTPQGTVYGTAFASPLTATVTSNNRALTDLSGGVVTFTAPATGASATLSSGTATLISGNTASVNATANSTLGSYSVSAGGTGIATPAPFSLTNDETPSLVVTTTQDVVNATDGLTSLREAIAYAAQLGSGTVRFAPALAGGTITLALGTLTINSSVSISGPGPGQLAISGAGTTQIFYIPSSTTHVVSISGLTLEDGATTGTSTSPEGGAIYNHATLTVSNDAFVGNTAMSGTNSAYLGGAISNHDALTIQGSTFTGNTAYLGAAVNANGSTTTNISGSTFDDNTAAFNGGALRTYGTTAVTSSTFVGNTGKNSGGAIIVDAGTLALTNDTIAGNNAPYGAGIQAQGGAATLTNVTIAGNTATSNSAGIGYAAGATVTAYNSIVAGNTAPSNPDVSTAILAATSADDLLDLSALAAGLGTLGNYGGPTQTIPLLPGSPAIGAGAPIAGVTTDQTGYTRSATAPSIGAYENEGFTITATGGTPQGTVNGTAFASPLTATVTSNNPALTDLSGGVVTFTAPATGASATLSSGTATLVSGNTASVTATAGATVGTYSVSAGGAGIATPAPFTLSNDETPSLVVTTNQDVVNPTDGLTSLREAIAYADSLGGGTITFASSLTGQTITLGGSQLELVATANPVTIDASSIGGITISGNTNSNLASRVFQVDSGATVYLTDLTITNGHASYANYGGGIDNSGVLTVTDSTLSNNSAGEGGGIANDDTLTVIDSTFSNDSAYGGSLGNGGGISNTGGTVVVTGTTFTKDSAEDGAGIYNDYNLTVTGSTFSNDSASFAGGGIVNTGGLTITSSTFSNDSGYYGPGGIFNYDGGTLTITRSTFSNDSAPSGAGGVIDNGEYATVTITNSTFSNDSGLDAGGAIENDGTLTITNSTLTNDSTQDSGGAIYNDGTLTITNSTLTNDSTQTSGGAISNSGTLTITNSTFSNDSAGLGGALTDVFGTLTITNSTFSNDSASYYTDIYSAGNTPTAHNSIFTGSIFGGLTGSNNLLSTAGLPASVGTVEPSLAAFGLGTLGNYGGPTQTIPLLPGSPAIGAGATISGITTDQRGQPRSYNGAVDVGAFQTQGYTESFVSGNNQTATVNPAGTSGSTFSNLVISIAANDGTDPVAGGVITFTASPVPGDASAVLGTASATITGAGTATTTAAPNSIGGSYTVIPVAAGVSSPVVFSLANTKATAVVTLSNLNLPYTGIPTGVSVAGIPQNVGVTTTPAGLGFDDTITLNGQPVRPPVAAGTYAITVTIDDPTYQGTATGNLVIAQAAPSLTLTVPSGAVYTGSPIGATATVAGLNNVAGSSLEGVPLSSITYAPYTGGSQGGAGSTTPPTAAGTYLASVSFAGSTDYTAGSTSQVFTIAQATSTTKAVANSVTYNGNPFSAGSTVTGTGGLNTVATAFSYAGTGTTAYGPSATPPTNAGSYTVTATYNGDANHTGSSGSTPFTIYQATPTISVVDAGGVFNGSQFGASGTVTGVNGANLGSPYYEYFLASDTSFASPSTTAPTAAGSYVAIGFSPYNANYVQVGQAAYFSITPAKPTVAVTAIGGTYTGSAIGATANVTGVSGPAAPALESVAPTLLYYAGQTASGTGTATTPTNAGTYTVVATFPGSADYSTASASQTFSITPAATVVTVSDAGGTYKGSPFPAAGTVTGAGGLSTTPTFSFVGTGGTSYSGATAPTNVGTYAVTATYAGDANHTGNAATVAFTITQATPTLTVADAGGVYNALPYAATGTTTGVNGTPLGSPTYRYYVSSDTSFSNPTTTAPTNVGSYVLIALSPVNANYVQVGVAVYFSITPASTSVAISSSAASGVNYGQSVTLTATVSAVAPGGGTPVGSVQFFSNGASLGTVALSNGSASLSTSGLALGDDAITATYIPGNANFSASSNSFTQGVTAGLVLLDSGGFGALTVTGSAKVNAGSSTIVVDSSSSAAVVVNGVSSVTSGLTDVVGGASVLYPSTVSNLKTAQKAVTDPLASLAAPSTAGMTVRSYSTMYVGGNSTVTLQPGIYNGGININGSANVTLAPGIYYLNGGGFNVGGAAKVSGTGVLLYNAARTSLDQINVNGAGSLTLAPATTGAYAGMTIFQARTSNAAIFVSGIGAVNVTGTVYAAAATVYVQGAGVVDTFGSTLIVDDLNVSGIGDLIV
jgi:uncharacterized repeat protein (TIGR03803 family)